LITQRSLKTLQNPKEICGAKRRESLLGFMLQSTAEQCFAIIWAE
jgi:hypothetical protein